MLVHQIQNMFHLLLLSLIPVILKSQIHVYSIVRNTVNTVLLEILLPTYRNTSKCLCSYV